MTNGCIPQNVDCHLITLKKNNFIWSLDLENHIEGVIEKIEFSWGIESVTCVFDEVIGSVDLRY